MAKPESTPRHATHATSRNHPRKTCHSSGRHKHRSEREHCVHSITGQAHVVLLGEHGHSVCPLNCPHCTGRERASTATAHFTDRVDDADVDRPRLQEGQDRLPAHQRFERGDRHRSVIPDLPERIGAVPKGSATNRRQGHQPRTRQKPPESSAHPKSILVPPDITHRLAETRNIGTKPGRNAGPRSARGCSHTRNCSQHVPEWGNP